MKTGIIGLTGTIGSGKSTVSKIMKDLGAAIIDADVIARTVTAKGSEALEELVSHFGSEILEQNGELNRKKLADIVFNDPVKLEDLNNITHKYIIRKILSSLNDLKASGRNEVVVLDAPLPVKRGFLDMVDEVWVVTSERETRIKRIMQRSGFTLEEATERINSQAKEEQYLGIADLVIENDSSIEELEKTVVKLYLQKKQEQV
jgi:dephospho-CoA kinase